MGCMTDFGYVILDTNLLMFMTIQACTTYYAHRAQTVLIRRDREIRIFGYFSFFMHARIISERDLNEAFLEI